MSQTSQRWPEEGSIVSGRAGWAFSLLALVLCVLGRGRGAASPVRGRDLSQPHSQQPASVIFPSPTLSWDQGPIFLLALIMVSLKPRLSHALPC